MSDQRISARVEAEISDYKRGMEDAAKATDEFRKKAESAAKPMTGLQTVMNAVSGAASGMVRLIPGVTAGWAGIGVAALGLSKNAAKVADEIGRSAEELGISTVAMSEYEYAARIAGVSSASLESGLESLSTAIAEDSDALRAMGVATRDATGAQRPLQAVLLDVTAKFSTYEAGAAKAAIGQEVFGRSFEQLLPLLNRGASGLADLTEEAHLFGVVISEDAAAEARRFNEDLERLSGLIPALAVEIGGPLVSSVRELAEEFLDARRAGLSLWESMTGIGLSDPTKSPAEHIARISKEIEHLNSLPAGRGGQKRGAAEIEYLEKELDYRRRRLNSGGSADPRDRAAGVQTTAPAVPEKPSTARTQRSPRAAAPPREDLNAGFDTAAAQDYARTMEALARVEADASIEAMNLNASQTLLMTLMMSPAWDRMPEPWRLTAVAQFEAANAAEVARDAQRAHSEAMKEGERLTVAMRTPSEALGAEIAHLNTLLSSGAINWETYSRAVFGAQDEFDRMNEKLEEVDSGMSEFSKNFAASAQSTISDLLFQGATEGFDGLVEGFGRALQRMAADAAAAQLMKSLLGESFGTSGKVDSGSWIGMLGSWLASADGNAFAGSGPVQAFAAGGAFGKGEVLTRPTMFRFAQGGAFRTGVAGEAGPEAALPLVRMANGKLGVSMDGGGGGGGGGVVVNQTFNFGGEVSPTGAQRVRQAAGHGARRVLDVSGGANRYA